MGKSTHRIRITPKVSYEVIWIDSFSDPETLGECCMEDRKILIRKDLSPRLTRQILLHELIHAIEFEFDIPIPHKIVYGLSVAMEKLFRLNQD